MQGCYRRHPGTGGSSRGTSRTAAVGLGLDGLKRFDSVESVAEVVFLDFEVVAGLEV